MVKAPDIESSSGKASVPLAVERTTENAAAEVNAGKVIVEKASLSLEKSPVSVVKLGRLKGATAVLPVSVIAPFVCSAGKLIGAETPLIAIEFAETSESKLIDEKTRFDKDKSPDIVAKPAKDNAPVPVMLASVIEVAEVTAAKLTEPNAAVSIVSKSDSVVKLGKFKAAVEVNVVNVIAAAEARAGKDMAEAPLVMESAFTEVKTPKLISG